MKSSDNFSGFIIRKWTILLIALTFVQCRDFSYSKAMYEVCYVNPVSPKEYLQLRNDKKKEIIPSCLSQNAPGYLSVFLNTTLYVLFYCNVLCVQNNFTEKSIFFFSIVYNLKKRQKPFLHFDLCQKSCTNVVSLVLYIHDPNQQCHPSKGKTKL